MLFQWTRTAVSAADVWLEREDLLPVVPTQVWTWPLSAALWCRAQIWWRYISHIELYRPWNHQSIKSGICKAPLKQSSQRHLLWVGLHKEPSLKARLELFVTNINVLEMRWQHVGVLQRGNCADHNVRSAYVVQSCHRCQQSEAENERERRWSVNRCRGSTLEIGHGYNRVISAILNVVRWDTRSQWNVSRNVGVMWSWH